MACDGIPAALRNLTVAFVGDSLMDELYTLAQCMLPLGGARRFTLNLVPDQASLARLMRTALAAADVVVFNFGLWYNFEPAVRPEIPAHVDESLVTSLIDACLERGLPDGGTRGNACRTDACMRAPGEGEQHMAYAYRRRYCAGTTGSDAYVSDLMRFASTLDQVAKTEHIRRASRLIWRGNTPQHYTTPSGFFPWARNASWPSAGACVPVEEDHQPLARSRNQLAERVLAPLLRAPPSAPARLEHMDTWDFDLAHHSQHPNGKRNEIKPAGADILPRSVRLHADRTMDDCSHFCLHSDVTGRWLEALVATMVIA